MLRTSLGHWVQQNVNLLNEEYQNCSISSNTIFQGSVVGLTALFPLDTVRTRLQVFDHEARTKNNAIAVLLQLVKEEGISGCYRGWFSVVSTLYCSNFIYFYVYHGLKTSQTFLGICPEGSEEAAWKDLCIAYTAGVINVLLTTPLWVTNTRIKLQGVHDGTDKDKVRRPYTGMLNCVWRILQEEGVGALWSGTGPSILLAANPAVHWMVYEGLKRYMQKLLGVSELSGLIYFLMGAIAKTVATVVTYPLQLVQTKQRAARDKSGIEKMGFIRRILYILRLNGLSGIFQGLQAKLLQTVLTSALMFLTYEKIAAAVFKIMGLENC